MRKRDVANLTKLSPSYISKLASGATNNDKSDPVLALLEVEIDKHVIEILSDDLTYDLCELALTAPKVSAKIRKHAVRVQQAREVLLRIITDK